MLNKFFKGINRKQSISWALYDFANSAYTVIIAGFVFPLYFKEFIVGNNIGDFWRGFAVSCSVFLGAVISPIIGAMADYDQKKKYKFIFFALLSMFGGAMIYFVAPGQLIFGLFVFIIANLCFEIAQILYDSFIGQISSNETSGRISGLGYGLGYIGGLIAMIILQPLYKAGYIPGMENIYMLTFPLMSLFFLIFALPSFVFIKEDKQTKKSINFLNLVKVGFRNVFATIKSLKKYKHIGLFILGFGILNDALVTVFSFVPIYAKTTLNFSMSEIMMILVLVQVIGLPASILFGRLSDKIGYKKVLVGSIVGWILITLFLATGYGKTMMYIVISLTGLVIGSSQSVVRSRYNKIVPIERKCEFFGFNGFASKMAAVIGPILFGIISVTTGSQRIAMASLIPFFVVALIIFYNVRE